MFRFVPMSAFSYFINTHFESKLNHFMKFIYFSSHFSSAIDKNRSRVSNRGRRKNGHPQLPSDGPPCPFCGVAEKRTDTGGQWSHKTGLQGHITDQPDSQGGRWDVPVLRQQWPGGCTRVGGTLCHWWVEFFVNCVVIFWKKT